jgi:hypothetical protein
MSWLKFLNDRRPKLRSVPITLCSSTTTTPALHPRQYRVRVCREYCEHLRAVFAHVRIDDPLRLFERLLFFFADLVAHLCFTRALHKLRNNTIN